MNSSDNNYSKENKFFAVLITTIASFIPAFNASSVNIALPSISNEFNLNAVLLSWIPLSYMLAISIFLLPIGRISDIYGRKKIFLIGVITFSAASFLCSLSFINIQLLILFRVLQGIGSAMIFTTNVAILTSIFSIEQRGKILGINVASVYTGLSSGPFIGGILTFYFGWRSMFFINVPLGMLIIILIFWKLKSEWKEAEKEKINFIGTVIYSASLFLLLLGFSILPGIKGFIIIISSIMLFIILIIIELNSKNTVLNLNLFKKNRIFTFSNLAALINYSATFGVGFILSLYLQNIKKLPPQKAGLILLSQPLLQAVFSPLAGWLSDKFEPGILASYGMILTTLGLFILCFIQINTSVLIILLSLIILGIGFALFSSPNTNAIMRSVDKKNYGAGSATLSTMRSLGQNLSIGLVTLLFALFLGQAKISEENQFEFIKSIETAFQIFTILCFAGIFFSLIRGKIYTNQ
jgi:EmrB/QacA subfamily drug resistance transporter